MSVDSPTRWHASRLVMRAPSAARTPSRHGRRRVRASIRTPLSCSRARAESVWSASFLSSPSGRRPRPAAARSTNAPRRDLLLYYLLIPLVPHYSALRIFNYISFRAAGAAVTAILLSFIVGPLILKRLDNAAELQVVREGTPDSHAAKANDADDGRLDLSLLARSSSTLLWARSLQPLRRSSALFVTLWMGVHRPARRYLKLKQKRRGEKNEGLVERYKLVGQVTSASRSAGISGSTRCRRTCPARRRRCRSSSTTCSSLAGFARSVRVCSRRSFSPARATP